MFKKIKYLLILLIIIITLPTKLYVEESSSAIFVYHRFGENKYPSTNIKISQFKKHIEELKKNNYNIVTVNEIVESLINNKELPEKTIALTIDDAFLSIYKSAWPIFKREKIPFTIFVSTEPLDFGSKNHMSWDQIKEISNSGGTIGHHTKSHMHLAGKDENVMIEEIEEANNSFLKNLGYVPDIFAYPYGEFDLKLKEISKKYFKASFGQHSGGLYKEIDLFELPRFALNEQYGDIKRFKFAANSYGLSINNILPKNKLIKDINPPNLGFNLLSNIDNVIKCYPSHGIKANLKKIGNNRIELRFDKEFPKGRTRINCTVNDNGKWRWTGFQFFNP